MGLVVLTSLATGPIAGAGATGPTKTDVGQESVRLQTFYDQAGTPVKVVVHDSFTETDTNSVRGKPLPSGGGSSRHSISSPAPAPTSASSSC
jgi:hypothetical protein